MGTKTNVEWCARRLNGLIIPGHTHNTHWGCLKVSPGCEKCYAEGIAHHWGHSVWGPASTTHRRMMSDANWSKPLTWNRQAEREGHRHNVFCNSMSDLYEKNPELDSVRERQWELIDNTPWLNWLLLTKRPENIMAMTPDRWKQNQWPDNVWFGTSVENQEYADKRIPYLLNIPAAVRFISYEPALGPVDFTPWLESLQWIIVGGESGENARPFDLNWARAVRNLIVRERLEERFIPFFFKQIGGNYHNSGGRMLDGRFWDEMPPEVPTICTCENCGDRFFAHNGYHEEENKTLGTLVYNYCSNCCNW